VVVCESARRQSQLAQIAEISGDSRLLDEAPINRDSNRDQNCNNREGYEQLCHREGTATDCLKANVHKGEGGDDKTFLRHFNHKNVTPMNPI
jgi:hypothetical protein